MRHVTVPLACGSVTELRSPSGQVHVSKPAAFLNFSPSAQYCSVSRSGDQPFSLNRTSAQSRGTSSNSEICLTLASIILATSSAPIKNVRAVLDARRMRLVARFLGRGALGHEGVAVPVLLVRINVLLVLGVAHLYLYVVRLDTLCRR